ncbi:hypothetical protein ACIQRS_19580 [Streptomyces termitum]|uniref:Uncharacterized protein n=1 Tax=Streptomyces termitum TaxID=67368 RepID=A0A918WCQ5_9ACTN|nr:hypothetical protein [Streptomyces termitum]GHB05032.1 hypothetical protein GCM10010305_55280 [Streptomyces termitum]
MRATKRLFALAAVAAALTLGVAAPASANVHVTGTVSSGWGS